MAKHIFSGIMGMPDQKIGDFCSKQHINDTGGLNHATMNAHDNIITGGLNQLTNADDNIITV